MQVRILEAVRCSCEADLSQHFNYRVTDSAVLNTTSVLSCWFADAPKHWFGVVLQLGG